MIPPKLFGHGRTARQRQCNKRFNNTWAKKLLVVRYPDIVDSAFARVWKELNGD